MKIGDKKYKKLSLRNWNFYPFKKLELRDMDLGVEIGDFEFGN